MTASGQSGGLSFSGGAASRRVNAEIIGLLTGPGNRKNRPGDLLRLHPRKTRLNSEERS
jgi:hypothetical protein